MVVASSAPGGTERTGAYRRLVDCLPFPAALLDAQDWRVLLANDAFARVVTAGAAPHGRSLRDVLPPHGGWPALAELLEEVRRGARPSEGATVVVEQARSGFDGPGMRWTMELQPLTDAPGTVWGALAWLRGGEDKPACDAEPPPGGGLRDLAAGLVVDKSARELYADIVRAAATAARAERGALLLIDGSRRLRIVASTPDAGLPARVATDELSSPVWEAALGHHRLAWSAHGGQPAPVPFAGDPGWEQLALAGLGVRGRALGAVVVGGPHGGDFDEVDLERLELSALLASAALDSARLRDQFGRLEAVMRGAVSISAALVEATEPLGVRRRLLRGLVEDMGMAGAALWCGDDSQPAGLKLEDAAGLPDDVRQRVARLPASSSAARLLSAEPAEHSAGATAAPTSSWPEHEVRLVPVPEPASGVLGVYTAGGLPALVDDLLATLAHALASAVHQTSLHRRVQTVVDSLVRELRPHARPAGVEVGYIYRSAAAGVEVGGDFFDLFSTATGHIGMACGDVSGKGVEAASLTAMAVYTLRAYALSGTPSQEVMSSLNAAVCEQTTTERFLTLAYARIDPVGWTVDVSVAGHPAPLLVGPRGVQTVDGPPDMPIGVDRAAGYSQRQFTLDPGCSLLLYTDGVTEARRAGTRGREQLGTGRLVGVLERHRHLGADALAEAVWDAVQAWSEGGTTDDCAVVVLRRPAAAGPAGGSGPGSG